TSRARRAATSAFGCTCIRNNQFGRVLAVASISEPPRTNSSAEPRRTNTMTITHAPDGYTVLPDDETLAGTVVALEGPGFSVEVVDALDAAREAVLARTA